MPLLENFFCRDVAGAREHVGGGYRPEDEIFAERLSDLDDSRRGPVSWPLTTSSSATCSHSLLYCHCRRSHCGVPRLPQLGPGSDVAARRHWEVLHHADARKRPRRQTKRHRPRADAERGWQSDQQCVVAHSPETAKRLRCVETTACCFLCFRRVHARRTGSTRSAAAG